MRFVQSAKHIVDFFPHFNFFDIFEFGILSILRSE